MALLGLKIPILELRNSTFGAENPIFYCQDSILGPNCPTLGWAPLLLGFQTGFGSFGTGLCGDSAPFWVLIMGCGATLTPLRAVMVCFGAENRTLGLKITLQGAENLISGMEVLCFGAENGTFWA